VWSIPSPIFIQLYLAAARAKDEVEIPLPGTAMRLDLRDSKKV
jgi:hypothetical protein